MAQNSRHLVGSWRGDVDGSSMDWPQTTCQIHPLHCQLCFHQKDDGWILSIGTRGIMQSLNPSFCWYWSPGYSVWFSTVHMSAEIWSWWGKGTWQSSESHNSGFPGQQDPLPQCWFNVGQRRKRWIIIEPVLGSCTRNQKWHLQRQIIKVNITTRIWANVGSASTTLAQHSPNNGSTYRVCYRTGFLKNTITRDTPAKSPSFDVGQTSITAKITIHTTSWMDCTDLTARCKIQSIPRR